MTENTRCGRHGGPLDDRGRCVTENVLMDVEEERSRQFHRYGTNEDLEDGTGGAWARPVSESSAEVLEKLFRADYEEHEAQHGRPTWVHLVREELAEAFQETDHTRLREELLQVAALCVSWIEKLDTRANSERIEL